MTSTTSQLNNIIVNAENNKPFILNCTSTLPDISFFWLQGPNAEYDLSFDDRIQSIDNGKAVLFTYIVSSDEDTYTCVGDFNNGTFKRLQAYFLFVKSKIILKH